MNDFDFQMMIHPQTDPKELVDLLPSMDDQRMIEVAHECLKNKSWKHLAAMQAYGFDLSASHMLGNENLAVHETLIHRCLRIHLYDGVERISHLLEMGADPHQPNGQGITPLGLLCVKSRDLPNHRTIEFFDLFEEYGVSLTDSCGKKGHARYLLDSDKPVDLLAKYCAELVPWAQAKILQEQTPNAIGKRTRRL